MKIAYFWMTQKGHELTCRLQKAMGGIIEPKAEFPKTVQRDFQDCDALVFVMAMGNIGEVSRQYMYAIWAVQTT